MRQPKSVPDNVLRPLTSDHDRHRTEQIGYKENYFGRI
jgi:hypothetical protein